MKEEFLQYIWRLKKFNFSNLETTDKKPVQIINTGEFNTHAGPDFSNARIKIDDTLWAGNVEIHVKSSDWMIHGHQNDKAYDTVILHVVFENDKPIFRTNGIEIPCLELKNRIPPKLSKVYLKLLNNEHWIPCQHHFYSVSEITKNLWFERLTIERLQHKITPIEISLKKNLNNWEETFYHFIARNFGVKINADAFESLAKSTPLKALAKHKKSLFQIEALLFGQSGLLDKDFIDKYPKDLKKEYLFLKKKFNLHSINPAIWKFMRLRPPNFPTIRIAQFASLIHRSVNLFSKILEVENHKDIIKLFNAEVSEYWQTHYVFDKSTQNPIKKLGRSTIELLIINTIIPFLFFYGKTNGIDSVKEKAIEFLENTNPENNSIITKWKSFGLNPKSASQTQALLQLKNEYCNKKQCLNCAIGNAILS